MSARLARLAAASLLLLPQAAQACAVCGGGNPANRFAFFASTIALSLLPLGLFGAGFLWLRRRIHAGLSDEFTERDVTSPESPLSAEVVSHAAGRLG